MKKKIYLNMILLSFGSVILVAAVLIFMFYSQFTGQVQSQIKASGVLLQGILNQSDEKIETLDSIKIQGSDERVSIVSFDGEVLYDNDADIKTLDNHADREEIIEAKDSGEGESRRYSNTLGDETYYYSVKLNNGMILRVSKTTDSVFSIFFRVFPIIIIFVLAMFLLCHFLARRLTKKIIMPINKINLNDYDKNEVKYDELLPFYKTIDHQKAQIKNQLSEMDQRAITLKTITDNMNEVLILLDKNSDIVSANKSALALFDATAGIYGKNIIEMTRNIELLSHINTAIAGVSSDVLLDISSRTYNALFQPVEGSGALILFMDVTDKQRSEKRRREFSANVSHELKTPLTSILGYAEMLENNMVKQDDVSNFTGKIKDESIRLISLIDDIIRLSQLDESKEESMEEFSMKCLSSEVMENLTNKADRHKVSLHLECNDVNIKANRQMIYEMLYNLLDNAIKYNVENGNVSVEIVRKDGKVNITVKDTGIGISLKDQNRIFERFYRSDKSRSKKTGGTGLGLSIVKHIVMYHDGTISLESKENAGTKVTIIM